MSTLRVDDILDRAGTALPDAGQVGVGQTWQDVTASRATGTTYTNSTGRPIVVYIVNVVTSNLGATAFFEIASGSVGFTGGNGATANMVHSHTFVVPAGATYRHLTVAGIALSKWLELRT